MKVIGLKIEIEGLSDITKEVVKLEMELKDLQTQLKATEVGSEAYIELRNQIAATTEQLKSAKKEQRDFVKGATETKEAEGSYFSLSKQLAELRKQYKSLSAAERDSAKGTELQKKIQSLDVELKKIDAGVGQFNRNVGNYPKGIGKIVKGLEQVIPGFENLSKQLQTSSGKLNIFGKALVAGFVAFQAAKLISKAVKALDEFVSKINETRETVAEFSGASGAELDKVAAAATAMATTFDVDAKTIAEAAQALSKNLGIGFEEALGKLEGALVEGRGNADDYLKTITEYPEAFRAATGEVTEFSERNKSLLATNKELAISQVDVAKRLTGVTDSLKQAGNAIYTGLFLILAQLIDIFKPVGAAFSRLFAAVSNFSQVFSTAGEKVDVFAAILDFAIIRPFKVIAFIFSAVADTLTYLLSGLKSIAAESPALQKVFQFLSDVGTQVAFVFNNLPSIFAGVIAALKQLALNFTNFFKTLSLDAQIFGSQIKEFFGANVDAAIAELRRRRAEIQAESISVGSAFAKGFNDAKAEADKIAADSAAQAAAETAAKARQAAATESNKDLKARIEKQREANKKIAEERSKYTEQEIKEAQSRAALLADLQARLVDETIKNIQNSKAKEIAEINTSFSAQINALKKQYDELNAVAIEREKELRATFGETSKELLSTQLKNKEALDAIAIAQSKIITELEAQKVVTLQKINESYRQEEIEKAKQLADDLRAFRDTVLSSEIEFIQQQSDARLSAQEESLNKYLALEADATKRIEAIRLAAEKELAEKVSELKNELQAVDDQEEFLKSQAAVGIEIKQDEYDAVLKARQRLNTELSALELQQTETIRAESQKQRDLRNAEIEKVAGYATSAIQILDGVLDNVNARQEAQFEEQKERGDARQEQLNTDIESATGLRKKFLQQQLADELKMAAELAKEQEKIQRNAARADKAIAITQSLIQGFLAISRAVASAPPPFNTPAIVAASIQAATQTALIVAQPLADGGAVSPVVLPDSGGKVIAAQNIPTTRRGDNVLVAARVGETFLNAKQTNTLRPFLAAARVPGFALGGMIGGVSTTPNLGGIASSEAETMRAFNARTEAISQQVLTTKVVLVTDELDRDTQQKNRIEKKSRFE